MNTTKKRKLLPNDMTIIDTSQARKAVFATGLGNAMEWFDFGIYSYLAVTIGKVFFPEMEGTLQLVYTFATFAIAFIMRPIGGFVFGALGDRLGRKRVLTITILMMAFSTLCIGLIPSYQSIGLTASFLLLAARLVQGFSTGGEYSGAMTYIAESSPDKKRGILGSGLEVGTLSGYIAGSGLVTILTFILGNQGMVDWGWRIPFFVAAPLGLIGFYLRTSLDETQAFQEIQESEQDQGETEKQPTFKDIFLYFKKELFLCIVIVAFFNITSYMLLSYMPSHLNAVLGYENSKSLLLILVVMLFMIPTVILMGHLSDKFGNKIITQIGLVGLILFAIPAFLLLRDDNILTVFLGLLLLALCLSCFEGTVPSMLPTLFFTDVRYRALSVSFNVSVSIFGGTTPMIASFLIDKTGNNLMPSFYLVLVGVIGMIVFTLMFKQTSGKSLRGSLPAVETKAEAKKMVNNPKKALWWRKEAKALRKKSKEHK
ncbi:MFS transporter [Listeria aquatica]|uniref:Putative proline/betaine transporter n=1 Tax=Listeria aquatica TaxID=1494960 RepID=A0A841ZLJ5_9LIST|nr:MFS transporter [Listeria aquatica]MBC1520055.1 MFS transporter [Listeria aquatica]